jgi:hypothetical protein
MLGTRLTKDGHAHILEIAVARAEQGLALGAR